MENKKFNPLNNNLLEVLAWKEEAEDLKGDRRSKALDLVKTYHEILMQEMNVYEERGKVCVGLIAIRANLKDKINYILKGVK